MQDGTPSPGVAVVRRPGDPAPDAPAPTGLTAEIDRRLAEFGATVDPLLAFTPVDTTSAWDRFKASGFTQEPELHYRAVDVDEAAVRAGLDQLAIDEVDDPALATLFREKQVEIGAELDLLLRHGTPSALAASTAIYGTAGPELVATAHRVLGCVAAEGADAAPGPAVDADGFAEAARAEVALLRQQLPDLVVDLEIRPDVSGVMVDRGRVLVGDALKLAPERVPALVQHEVGTHVVTWVNGGRQRITLLQCGLPRYDETQEALAVLAEHLVGGLTAHRMATLAARVVAVASVVDGASFVETFRALTEVAPLAAGWAFDVTVRVHRGGGFTKDVVYLRGLQRLVDHLAAGGDLEPLLVGKFSLEHLPLIDDLRGRGNVAPPALAPRWLQWPGAEARRAELRDGVALEALIGGTP